MSRPSLRPSRFVSLAAAVLLSACSGSLPQASPTGGPTQEPSATASTDVTGPTGAPTSPEATADPFPALGALNPDGTVPVDVAARAFSLLFAPLPGVTAPEGVDVSALSADAALRWIDETRDELTEEQRLAVDAALAEFEDPYAVPASASVGAALAGPGTASSHQVCSLFLGDGEPPTDAPEPVRPYAETISALVGDYNRKLGRASLLKMGVCLRNPTDSRHPAVGRVYDSNSLHVGPPDHCVVFIQAPQDVAAHWLNMHMAYSTFTCFRETAQPGGRSPIGMPRTGRPGTSRASPRGRPEWSPTNGSGGPYSCSFATGSNTWSTTPS